MTPGMVRITSGTSLPTGDLSSRRSPASTKQNAMPAEVGVALRGEGGEHLVVQGLTQSQKEGLRTPLTSRSFPGRADR